MSMDSEDHDILCNLTERLEEKLNMINENLKRILKALGGKR